MARLWVKLGELQAGEGKGFSGPVVAFVGCGSAGGTSTPSVQATEGAGPSFGAGRAWDGGVAKRTAAQMRQGVTSHPPTQGCCAPAVAGQSGGPPCGCGEVSVVCPRAFPPR